MNFLQSNWFCAAVGSLLYLGTTVAVWKTPPVERHHVEVPEADFIGNSPQASWNFHNAEVDELVADLKKQREQLNAREKQLNDLSARLELERHEITTVMESVTRAQKEFDTTIVRVGQEETVNLKKLAKIYAAMTPDGAAAILKELKDDDIVKIFAFMKEGESAPILEQLAKTSAADAARTAHISERMRVTLARGADKPKS
jgi:flagellar motility protein MotE (MotC chaperone)